MISVNYTQVSKNVKHLPWFCCLYYTRDNGDANVDFSSQWDVSATWKLSEKMDSAELNLHKNIPNSVQLRPESCAS